MNAWLSTSTVRIQHLRTAACPVQDHRDGEAYQFLAVTVVFATA